MGLDGSLIYPKFTFQSCHGDLAIFDINDAACLTDVLNLVFGLKHQVPHLGERHICNVPVLKNNGVSITVDMRRHATGVVVATITPLGKNTRGSWVGRPGIGEETGARLTGARTGSVDG